MSGFIRRLGRMLRPKPVLIDGWRGLHRYWSVQIMAAIAVLALLADQLPALQAFLPAKWYAWLSVAAIVARAIRQTQRHEQGADDAN